MHRGLKIALLVLFLCASTWAQAFIDVAPADLSHEKRRAYIQTSSDNCSDMNIVPDIEINRFLRQVLTELLAGSPQYFNTKYFHFRIALTDSDAFSSAAVACGDGYIYFAIRELCSMQSVDQVVMIVAHEGGHTILWHPLLKVEAYNRAVNELDQFLQVNKIPTMQHVKSNEVTEAYNKLVQSFETNADALGYKFTLAAGYNPAETVKYFKFFLRERNVIQGAERVEERIALFEQRLKQETNLPKPQPLPKQVVKQCKALGYERK